MFWVSVEFVFLKRLPASRQDVGKVVRLGGLRAVT